MTTIEPGDEFIVYSRDGADEILKRFRVEQIISKYVVICERMLPEGRRYRTSFSFFELERLGVTNCEMYPDVKERGALHYD